MRARAREESALLRGTPCAMESRRSRDTKKVGCAFPFWWPINTVEGEKRINQLSKLGWFAEPHIPCQSADRCTPRSSCPCALQECFNCGRVTCAEPKTVTEEKTPSIFIVSLSCFSVRLVPSLFLHQSYQCVYNVVSDVPPTE